MSLFLPSPLLTTVHLKIPIARGDDRPGYRLSQPLIAVEPAGLNEDVVSLSVPQIRTEGGTAEEGQKVLAKLRQVAAHAQQSKRLFPNFSQRHYGAAVALNNGVEALGTNVEASRQTSICDLRIAIATAVNQSVGLQPLKTIAILPSPLQVQKIFLANADLKGARPIPCSDCQEWMNSQFCLPETQVVSLESDGESGGELVRFRTVGDILPLHKGRPEPVRMVTEKPLQSLPITLSDSARAVLHQPGRKLTSKAMQTMLQKANVAYQEDAAGASESGLKTGVCMKLGPWGSLHSGGRFDWSTRWFEPADLQTAAHGFVSVWRAQKLVQKRVETRFVPQFIHNRLVPFLAKPDIQAVAYVGDDPSLPPVMTLGRMARRRGSSETLN